MGKNGLAFIIVLVFILLLIIVTTSFMLISNSEIKMVRGQNYSTKAFYLAEAGIEHARVQLKQNWDNDDPLVNIPLGEGTYNVEIYDTDKYGDDLPDDKLRIKSTGQVGGFKRTVEVIVDRLSMGNPDKVTSAIEAEGDVNITGDAEVEGNIEEYATLNFEDIFGASKEEMEEIAKTLYPDTYYETAFKNDVATGFTWISTPGKKAKITQNNWEGSGILIVEGDLEMTGGNFDGVIWVMGTLSVSSGNPDIDGAIFVECGDTQETKIAGTADIEYDEVEDAFFQLPSLLPEIENWQEIADHIV